MATIVGNSNHQFLVGTIDADSVADGGGADFVRGLGGNDTITAGSGNDWFELGAGADTLVLSAGFGIDIVDPFTGAGAAPYSDAYQVNGIFYEDVFGYRTGDHYAFTGIGGADNLTFLDFFAASPPPFGSFSVPKQAGGTFIGLPSTDSDGNGVADVQEVQIVTYGTAGADTLVLAATGNHSNVAWGGGGNDTISGSSRFSILYGGGGNDTLNVNTTNVYSYLLGGNGGDTYNVGVGETAIVYDFGGAGDVINAAGVGFFDPNTYAAMIDGRHLWVGNTSNNTQIIVIDWQTAANRIDSVVLNDGTYSYAFVAANLFSAPGYLGNMSWEAFTSGETTTAEIDDSIAQILDLAGNDQGPTLNLTVGGSAGGQILEGFSGANTLVGDTGNDTLRGMGGNDVYAFRVGDGADTVDNITGASLGEENLLWLGGGALFRSLSAAQGGSDLVIGYGAGDSVRLSGWYGPNAGLARQVRLGVRDAPALLLLEPGTVGGAAGEAAIGTSGADSVSTSAGDDWIAARAGNDTVDGGINTDTVVFSGARASYSVQRSGQTLIVTDLDGAANGGDDGQDTLIDIECLQFSDGLFDATTFAAAATHGDFNGDARSDLLWSNGAGSLAQWQQNGTAYVGGGVFAAPPSDWTIAGVADFNGDGAADILWQHSSGALAEWHMDGITYVGGGVMSGAGTGWTLGAVADFNGDAKADLLWRHSSGAMGMWFLDGTAYVGGGVFSGPGGSWAHAATADFNGDGRADLLWSDGNNLGLWLMDGTGYIGGGVLAGPAGSWTLKAVADFSGDGMADLLWSDGGDGLAQWHMSGTSYIGGGVFSAAGAGWSLASVADFEGDGHADLLWEHSSGALSLWAMDGTSVIGGDAMGIKPAGWNLVTLGQFANLPLPPAAPGGAMSDIGDSFLASPVYPISGGLSALRLEEYLVG